MSRVKILAKDNSKPCNHELVDFLDLRMEALVKGGFRFQFKVVADDEVPLLIKNGVEMLPVLMHAGKTISGITRMKSYLLGLLGNKVAVGRPQQRQQMDPEDEVRMFMMNEMTPEALERDKDEGNPQKDMDDALSKANQMAKERKEAQQQENERSGQASGKAPKRANNVRYEPSKGGGSDIQQAVVGTNEEEQMIANMLDETLF